MIVMISKGRKKKDRDRNRESIKVRKNSYTTQTLKYKSKMLYSTPMSIQIHSFILGVGKFIMCMLVIIIFVPENR